jgi:hypothetical protein
MILPADAPFLDKGESEHNITQNLRFKNKNNLWWHFFYDEADSNFILL